MEFYKLKTDLKALEPDMLRIDNDEYFEMVVKKIRIDDVQRVLEDIFGPPSEGLYDKLSKEVKGVINNIGGLRKGQILYFLEKDGFSMFAMLWPWQDGERVTIKIASVRVG